MAKLRLIIGLLFVCALVCNPALAARQHHRRNATTKVENSIESPVNINSADAETLVTLRGIGPKKAAAIVAYRNAHGSFASLNSLTAVKGIGEKFIVRLKKNNPGRIIVR